MQRWPRCHSRRRSRAACAASCEPRGTLASRGAGCAALGNLFFGRYRWGCPACMICLHSFLCCRSTVEQAKQQVALERAAAEDEASSGEQVGPLHCCPRASAAIAASRRHAGPGTAAGGCAWAPARRLYPSLLAAALLCQAGGGSHPGDGGAGGQVNSRGAERGAGQSAAGDCGGGAGGRGGRRPAVGGWEGVEVGGGASGAGE